MDKKRMIGIALAVIFMVCMVYGMPSAVIAEDNEEDQFVLEEIVVTAQKQEQNQQKVPITMEIVSGEEIKKYGKTDIELVKQLSYTRRRF